MIYLMMMDAEEDKRKFVVLYEQYKYLMLKVAQDVLADNYLAEDAVHEAFIKIAKNMDKIGDIKTRETKRYLITITKNTSIDIYRKRSIRAQKEVFIDELGDNELPFAYIETDMDHRMLDILRNLPVKYRDVFILKYASRMDNDEIAELLHISEGNVRQRIARGKEIIREAFESMEVK